MTLIQSDLIPFFKSTPIFVHAKISTPKVFCNEPHISRHSLACVFSCILLCVFHVYSYIRKGVLPRDQNNALPLASTSTSRWHQRQYFLPIELCKYVWSRTLNLILITNREGERKITFQCLSLSLVSTLTSNCPLHMVLHCDWTLLLVGTYTLWRAILLL